MGVSCWGPGETNLRLRANLVEKDLWPHASSQAPELDGYRAMPSCGWPKEKSLGELCPLGPLQQEEQAVGFFLFFCFRAPESCMQALVAHSYGPLCSTTEGPGISPLHRVRPCDLGGIWDL